MRPLDLLLEDITTINTIENPIIITEAKGMMHIMRISNMTMIDSLEMNLGKTQVIFKEEITTTVIMIVTKIEDMIIEVNNIEVAIV